MGKEPAVIEPGIINIEAPVERTSNGSTGEIVRITLLNDCVTECSYVTFVLVEVDGFNVTLKEADGIMWHAHFYGEAFVGYYTKDIAVKIMAEVSRTNAACNQYPRFIIS